MLETSPPLTWITNTRGAAPANLVTQKNAESRLWLSKSPRLWSEAGQLFTRPTRFLASLAQANLLRRGGKPFLLSIPRPYNDVLQAVVCAECRS